jgi:hypothetical protein
VSRSLKLDAARLPYRTGTMDLKFGNKNILMGGIALLLALPMTFFIERAGADHGFHDKAAQAVIDGKNTPQLEDDVVTEAKRGPAYRVGGLYYKNYYPDSYIRVFNFYREAGLNTRLFLFVFGFLNILVGIVVGLKTGAGKSLRKAASILALIGFLFILRDFIFFWGRYGNADFSPMASAPLLYPLMIIGGIAMFLAIAFSLVIFRRGIENS